MQNCISQEGTLPSGFSWNQWEWSTTCVMIQGQGGAGCVPGMDLTADGWKPRPWGRSQQNTPPLLFGSGKNTRMATWHCFWLHCFCPEVKVTGTGKSNLGSQKEHVWLCVVCSIRSPENWLPIMTIHNFFRVAATTWISVSLSLKWQDLPGWFLDFSYTSNLP